jgi:hypothetical protein
MRNWHLSLLGCHNFILFGVCISFLFVLALH